MDVKEYEDLRTEIQETNERLESLQEIVENNVMNIYSIGVELKTLYDGFLSSRRFLRPPVMRGRLTE